MVCSPKKELQSTLSSSVYSFMDWYVYAWTCVRDVCVYLCQTCFGVWMYSCGDCPCELVYGLLLFPWFYRVLYLWENNIKHFIEDSKYKHKQSDNNIAATRIFDPRLHEWCILNDVCHYQEQIEATRKNGTMNENYRRIHFRCTWTCIVCQFV